MPIRPVVIHTEMNREAKICHRKSRSPHLLSNEDIIQCDPSNDFILARKCETGSLDGVVYTCIAKAVENAIQHKRTCITEGRQDFMLE